MLARSSGRAISVEHSLGPIPVFIRIAPSVAPAYEDGFLI